MRGEAMGGKSTTEKARRLRKLPSVDELLRESRLERLGEEVGRGLLVDAIRKVLAEARGSLRRGLPESQAAELLAHLPREIEAEVRELLAISLRPVINATGVVLHTNLGRAPLAPAAAAHVAEVARQYSALEFDLGRGRRGRRDIHAAKFFKRALGAEASIVVNNNAAALLLVLNTLAEGGEVVVSRGELVEIGESFRIPDILAKSGATLREVGTTNRTRIVDYSRAFSKRTRMVLRVHPSNFRVLGFTERPDLRQLAALARRHSLPLVEDLGSGLLVDLSEQGMRDEPVAGASLRAGVGLVTFSGDKLLGGPQAGVIAGRKRWVETCRRNPLFRALRVDKMTYAALEATLHSYLCGRPEEIPALRFIRQPLEAIALRADHLCAQLENEAGAQAAFEVVPGESLSGGGSWPGYSLPTRLVAISPSRFSPAELAARLRRTDPPVIVRVEGERVLVDLRTVFKDQEEALLAALRTALAS